MSNTFSLSVVEGEPRIDSRLVATELGVDHKSARKLIEQYSTDFEELGVWRFEIAKPSKDTLGGRPEKFYLLNEDQTYFLMTLVRNTDEAVNLKKRLVKSFSQYRMDAAWNAQEERYGALFDEKMVLWRWLNELKPEIGKIFRFRRAGLTQQEVGRALGWGEKRVWLAEKKLTAAGLLRKPSQRQLSLLEG